MNNNPEIKKLAAALYEIRCQLGMYLGSKSDASPEIRLAAHLAYAYHNIALDIINEKDPSDKHADKMVLQAEKVIGRSYIDSHKLLKNYSAQQSDASETMT